MTHALLCLWTYTSLAIKDEKSWKNPTPPEKPIHQVTTCADNCEVIKAGTNGCKNTIWFPFLPPWWEQNWCRIIGLQTKKVSKQISFPNGTQIWENAIRKNQVWKNGAELFRREKGQPTKRNKRYEQENICKEIMQKLGLLSDMIHYFIKMLSYQFNSTDFHEAELAKC